MIGILENSCKNRMNKVIDNLILDLKKIRTGRASTELLNDVKVDYYGTETPISQVASIAVTDARTLKLTPWESNLISSIEKAIIDSGLGLNPVNLGNFLKIPMPPLSQDRRKDLIKVVKNYAEQAKISIRNIRRDINSKSKLAVKDKSMTQDEEKISNDKVQKITDNLTKKVDEVYKSKEEELMTL